MKIFKDKRFYMPIVIFYEKINDWELNTYYQLITSVNNLNKLLMLKLDYEMCIGSNMLHNQWSFYIKKLERQLLNTYNQLITSTND